MSSLGPEGKMAVLLKGGYIVHAGCAGESLMISFRTVIVENW